jgi:hypothetical protein
MKTIKRVMGELVFTTPDEAETVGAKFKAAGFEFKITSDVDEYDVGVRFMMIWRDYDAERAPDRILAEFRAVTNAVIAQNLSYPDYVDLVGFVRPDHVPARFSDYGN